MRERHVSAVVGSAGELHRPDPISWTLRVNKSAKREALYSAFRAKAIEPDGTLLLLNAPDAMDFIDTGKAADLQLAGVEGFSVTDLGAYEPRQEFSNDYADFKGSRSDFEVETKALIRRGAAVGIRFEVVFEED